MIFKILYIIIATLLSAFCYRVGGMSKDSAREKIPWFPQFLVDGWFRDLNCTLITLGYYYLFMPKVAGWLYLVSGLALYLSTTTYFDDKFPPKGVDKFWLHGLMMGLSTLFLGGILAGLFRALIMCAVMGIVCGITEDDDVEELTRGGITQLSLLTYLKSIAFYVWVLEYINIIYNTF